MSTATARRRFTADPFNAGVGPTVDIDRFFAPENLTPHQGADMRRTQARSPEIRLVVAILEDAIHVMQHKVHGSGGYSYRSPLARLETEAWFDSSDSAPFSYRWCCETVGIDAPAFLAALRAREWRVAVPRKSPNTHNGRITTGERRSR
jgi:hypothetical protein